MRAYFGKLQNPIHAVLTVFITFYKTICWQLCVKMGLSNLCKRMSLFFFFLQAIQSKLLLVSNVKHGGFLKNCFMPTGKWSRELPNSSIHLLKLGNNSTSRAVQQRGCPHCVLLLTPGLRSTCNLSTGFCFRSHFLVSLNATHTVS